MNNWNLREMSYGLLVRTCTILIGRDLMCKCRAQPQRRTADREGCCCGKEAPAGLGFEFLAFWYKRKDSNMATGTRREFCLMVNTQI